MVQAPKPEPVDEPGPVHETAGRLLANVERVVIGKREEITLVLAALVSGGHVLLEDVPGTAKTILARSIAQTIDGAAFSRLQCTPDLQPTDVTGLSIFNQKTREFEFRAGPVFANVVLVDEINRAMPRTQSALLEAMAERQVTVDGVTRPLPAPFLVLATENPIDQEGTFPLPEAQLDRFALRAGLGYPHEDEEVSIVLAQRHGHPIEALEPAVTADELRTLQRAVEDVYVDELLLRWTVELVRATRQVEGVAIGASVRGSLTLERTARAWALLHGRDHVVPDDVERLFLPVLGHRLFLTASFLAETRGLRREEALATIRDRCLELAPPPGARLGQRRAVSVRERRTFPLVPRRRLTGLPFGDLPSRRRGPGSDVIGSRPYEPGDPVSTIDWFATARLSAASGGDEFVVRDRAADEAPRVAVVVDRRPAMGLYPAPLPWLAKRDALREAVASIVASAAAARADIAALDYADGEAWWLPPGRRDRPWLVAERQGGETPFDAPEDTIERALAFLRLHRTDLPGGSFVFVLSDLLAPVVAGGVARRDRPRLGSRAGGDPGSGLGAQLSGDRRRGDPDRGPAHWRARRSYG